MKRNIIRAFILFTVTVSFFQVSNALQLDPSMVTNVTEVKEIVLFADAPDNIAGVQVRLKVDGAKITSLVTTDESFMVIGVCEGEKSFTENTVCFDLASDGELSPTAQLATLSLELTSDNAIIRTAEDNLYVTTDNAIYKNEGVLAKYSKTDTLREESIGSYNILDVQDKDTGADTVTEQNQTLEIAIIVILVILGIGLWSAVFYKLWKNKQPKTV